MAILAIIQARMSSSRLPGKSLHAIEGQPLIGHLLDSLEQSQQLDGTVLATSEDPSDDPIAEYCARRGVRCVRGDLLNVAARFSKALESCPCDGFVRVCGDSPLLDHRIVDRCVARFRNGSHDMVSNKVHGGFPPGQSVEALKSDFFLDHFGDFSLPDDREHVTHYFYRTKLSDAIDFFKAENDYAGVDLAVDTPEDIERCKRIMAEMTAPPWSYDLDGVVSLLKTAEARLKQNDRGVQ